MGHRRSPRPARANPTLKPRPTPTSLPAPGDDRVGHLAHQHLVAIRTHGEDRHARLWTVVATHEDRDVGGRQRDLLSGGTGRTQRPGAPGSPAAGRRRATITRIGTGRLPVTRAGRSQCSAAANRPIGLASNRRASRAAARRRARLASTKARSGSAWTSSCLMSRSIRSSFMTTRPLDRPVETPRGPGTGSTGRLGDSCRSAGRLLPPTGRRATVNVSIARCRGGSDRSATPIARRSVIGSGDGEDASVISRTSR